MKNTLITMLTVVNFLVKDVERYFDIIFHKKGQVIINQPGNVTMSLSVSPRTEYFNEVGE
jgi:hypothetical protein